ncbi:purple acid phosphatase 2 isoform X2 [Selaginella moellendorffii]|uniref:purple acid phosphatase 2 isoform X2 n=1 Tax=Selaginella moellendorffii TaxID=88036 RepID=UPI000D1C57E4|nr:purple acid phosphatase 2 isoform X2 [Selaginella moellendorffii]|eukprot:XP_024522507.1 purple acid phosphatase 2 isoform X2 [Selaginella moellendorffii]
MQTNRCEYVPPVDLYKVPSQARCEGPRAWMAINALASGLPLLLLTLILQLQLQCGSSGITSPYRRRLQASEDLPVDSEFLRPPDLAGCGNAPEQVHITQGSVTADSMIVSWVTPSQPGSLAVSFGNETAKYSRTATGNITTYKYANYTSGYIHHVKLTNLEYATKYYYRLGDGECARQFWFVTAPKSGPDVAYTFGVIGDLGQTYDSLNTFQHYLNSSGQTLLYVGDLSYADHYPLDDNNRWDTWGRLVEPSTAYQPWIWTAGNHELDYRPAISEVIPFKPYLHRYQTPHRSSKSTSQLWYSINRASAHIIVLSSYSAYGKYTPQWAWLQNDLQNINRKETPWVIVLMHSPWYNSNTHHYMEGETMRVQFEAWFVQYRVDIVFAGHVHAYERSHRVSNIEYNVVNGQCSPSRNESAPVYITVGDGGNIEGLAGNFMQPQPNYSAYREASFGHAMLEIKNRTHAFYYWHRNQDGEAVKSDSTWLTNRHNHVKEERSLPRRRLPL